MTDSEKPRPVFAPLRTSRWRRKANCLGAPVDVFFPERGGDTATPMALCRACSVVGACRRWALSSPWAPSYGIVGGLSERTRRRLRHERNAAPYAPIPNAGPGVLSVAAVALPERRSAPRRIDGAGERQNGPDGWGWEAIVEARRSRAANAIVGESKLA